jgi:hypothetical protein
VADWLILVVPLLLVPIVFLLAFAGCNQILGNAVPPYAPPQDMPMPMPMPMPTAMGPTYDQVVLMDGPAAYWRLDDKKGSPDAKDSAPNQLNGKYRGTVSLEEASVLPKLSGAAGFDGTTGYVEVPYDMRLNPPMAFSIELWFKPTPNPAPNPDGSAAKRLVSSYAGPMAGFDLTVAKKSNSWTVTAGVFPDATKLVAQDVGQAVDWRHVVVTFGGGTLSLWVDGKLAKDQSGLNYSPNTKSAFLIGAGMVLKTMTPGFHYDGLLDEIAFYGVALPQATIEKHYAARMAS